MARSRGVKRREGGGGGDTSLGVGGLAGPLAHGERGVVESVATAAEAPVPLPPMAPVAGPSTPASMTAPGGAQLGSPSPPPIDLYGPSQRPDEPLTAGLAGPTATPLIPPDPDEAIRALYETAISNPRLQAAAEDLRRLLEGRLR